MPITRRSLNLLRHLRVEVGTLADDAVRKTAEAWLTAWDALSPAWQAAIAACVEQAARTGRWPAAWQIARIPEVGNAVTVTEQAAGALVGVAATASITAGVGAVAATALAEPFIIASQLPPLLAATAAGGYAARILPTALDVIKARVTQRITALTRPLSDDATTAAKQALVRGVQVGANPTVTARDILNRVQGAFSGGRDRAVNIARTETLDAMRVASAYAHQANADVLSGWTWCSDLSSRTCPACWSMHGTVWPLDHPGPNGHQQCRCARIPNVKPWPQLGIADTGPADVTPDAEKRFRAMSKADQVKVMGAVRLELLDSGHVTFADLAVLRTTRGWRDSYAPRSVADLRRIAGRRNP